MDEGHAIESLVSSSIPLQQPSLQGPVDRLARHRRVVAQVMGPAAAGATGQFVRASDPRGGPLAEDYDDRIYECVTPGTTDAVQPTYDTTIGQGTTDGTAVFRAYAAFTRAAAIATVTSAHRCARCLRR